MSGMEAVVIHCESPSRLETYFYLVIMTAGERVVQVLEEGAYRMSESRLHALRLISQQGNSDAHVEICL
jgi:hypothetical protein